MSERPSCPVVIFSLPYLVLAAFSSFTLSRSLAGVFSAYRPPNEILCQGLILTEPREDSGLVNLYSFDLRKFVGIVAKQCLTLRVAVLKCKIRKRFRSLIWSEQAKSCFLWLPRPSLTSPPASCLLLALNPSGLRAPFPQAPLQPRGVPLNSCKCFVPTCLWNSHSSCPSAWNTLLPSIWLTPTHPPALC